MARKRTAEAAPEEEPAAKHANLSDGGPEIGILHLPDTLLSLICEFVEQDQKEYIGRRIKTVLLLRLACRRLNQWFERLPFNPRVFRLRLAAKDLQEMSDWEKCPFKMHVQSIHLPDPISEPRILSQLPNLSALETSYHDSLHHLVTLLPKLDSLCLRGSLAGSRRTPRFPELPRLQSIVLADLEWCIPRDFAQLHSCYPCLQKIRIHGIAPDIIGEYTPLVLPQRLVQLEVPFWLFLLARARPGTVIQYLEIGQYDDVRGPFLQAMQTDKYVSDMHVLENMRNVSVAVVAMPGHLFMLTDLFEWILGWGIQFTDTLVVRTCLVGLTELLLGIWHPQVGVLMERFKNVEIETSDDSKRIAVAVMRSTPCGHGYDLCVPSATRFRIYSSLSIRGACTLLYRPKYDMFDIVWDDRPSKRRISDVE